VLLVHNDRMIRPWRRAGLRPLALALAATLLLASCAGGDDDPGADPGSSASSDGSGASGGTSSSAPTAEEPYLPVPDGVKLTAQGSELSLGDKATVAYEPRQDEVAALELTVTRVEKASFKLFVGWKLSKETLRTTPYFVHAKVTNVGGTNLGEERVPLYAVDGDNKLIESSTFESTFKPCPSASLPEKFRDGDKTSTCLVYLAPEKGEVTAVSFRPTEDFAPIVWTGEVTRPEALQKDGDANGGKQGGKQDQKG
jgi:hypothetical protein